jgi:DNA-nicking Smr family endonuclease
MAKKLNPEDQHLWELNTRDVKVLPKTTRLTKKRSSSPRYHDLRIPSPSFEKQELVPSSPLPSFDKKSLRHIAIEARLDLHGLTLDAGYQALETFLKNAQERGLKTILVITGKGRGEYEMTFRSQLPRWLEETALRRLVSSLHHPAKMQDGGTGAFYVRVKRKDI